MRRRTRFLALLPALCLLLCGCAAAGSSPAGSDSLTRAVGDGSVSYTAPPFAASAFHGEPASAPGEVRLDLSALADGYVAVSACAENRLKFQVLKEDDTYNYDLPCDGRPAVFPLQCGSGQYAFRVLENVGESKYAQIDFAEAEVVLSDEFQPFLRPSVYADFGPDSVCVEKAAELASGCFSALEVVRAVYDYVCATVSYDAEKALAVQSGYLPDPDETLRSGKGICFDYAALAAAMLRSQGIPTKLIFGYVSPDELYHAWNMFYTEESGWVTVSFEVSGPDWARMDLTFSAGGADGAFIGDGSNYTDLYTY